LHQSVAHGADFACPAPATQKDYDVKGEINGKAQTLLRVGNAELNGKIHETVVDLFSKYPNADRVVIIRDLTSTTCNFIKNATQLTDSQKLEKWMTIFPAIQSLIPNDKKSDNEKPSSPINIDRLTVTWFNDENDGIVKILDERDNKTIYINMLDV